MDLAIEIKFNHLLCEIIMTTTYYIEHNGDFIDQATSMDELHPRMEALIKANPNNTYRIAIAVTDNPVPQPTDTTPT
jgi:hypothetical protein